MAISYDTTTNSTNTANPLTWSHTVASGASALVVLAKMDSGYTFSSCTYDGAAMTQVWANDNETNNISAACYVLVLGSSDGAAHNIVVTGNDSGAWTAGLAMSFAGVTAARSGYSTHTYEWEAPTITVVNSEADDWAVDALVSVEDPSPAGSGQTDYDVVIRPWGGTVRLAMSTKICTGSNTAMVWESSHGYNYGALALVPSGSVTGQPTMRRWANVPGMGRSF